MDSSHPARMSPEEFNRLTEERTPFKQIFGFHVEAIGHGSARCRLPASESALRPGGTISGPAQMALADYALYAAILGALGEVAEAVTTNLTINFLVRPQPGDLVADCRLLKLGRRLAVGEGDIRDAGGTLVSHCTATYSIPPAAASGTATVGTAAGPREA